VQTHKGLSRAEMESASSPIKALGVPPSDDALTNATDNRNLSVALPLIFPMTLRPACEVVILAG
jgi:hypothetical protein